MISSSASSSSSNKSTTRSLIKNEKNNFYLFQDPKEILSMDCSILNYQFYVKYSIDIDSKIGKFVAEPSIN